MREHALTPHRVRAWLATTNSDHKQPIYPNLRSSITPEGPDELWVADLTYIRLTTGFVFLAVVLDAWSRRVIGYAISHLLDTRLCLAALDAALDLRQPRAGLVPPLRSRGPGWIQEVVATPQERGGVAMAASKRRRSDRALRPPMCSPGRPTVGRREHRQRFWEEVARGLSSEKSAVAAGVSPAVGARWLRQCGGMPPFSLRPLSGRYLSFVERRRDCGSSCWRFAACARSPGSWAAHRRRSRENCGGRSSNTKWKPRVSSHSRPMACRSTSETSESCQTRCKQRTEAVCAGSPWRPDRGSRRGGCAGP